MDGEKKGNYKRQFKAFGIAFVITAIIAAVLIASGLIGPGAGIGLALAVAFFEAVYFFILRDRSPEPLTQVNMRKDVDDFYKEEDK